MFQHDKECRVRCCSLGLRCYVHG